MGPVADAFAIRKPEPQHVDRINADLVRICGRFEIAPSPGRRDVVRGDVSSVNLGGRFETAVVSVDADRITRDKSDIRRDPGDHLFLLIQDEGQCEIVQGGRRTMLHAGDMFIADSSIPSEFHYGGMPSRQVSLHLSRDEMLSRFGPACAGGVSIDRADPLWAAVRAVLEKMAAETGPQSARLAEAFMGLLGAYIHCREAQKSLQERAARAVLARALDLIDRNFADPEFGPGDIARRLGVSDRTLQRHFRQLGETPGRRLQGIRLDHAYGRLTTRSSSDPNDQVGAIAYACGFNDLSHFYKAFRSRYGIAPGAVERRLLT